MVSGDQPRSRQALPRTLTHALFMSMIYSHPLRIKFAATDSLKLFLRNENIVYKDYNQHVARREYLSARADREMNLYKKIHNLHPSTPLGVYAMQNKGIFSYDEAFHCWAEKAALENMVRARLPSCPCHAPPLPCMR